MCVVIKQFLNYVYTQFGKIVKVIRSKNGTEFVNSMCSTMLSSLGIVHQTSFPYTPQQNGIVERKHKHILEVTRALRFQAELPMQF